MAPFRSDIDNRGEHERALRQAGMRQYQSTIFDHRPLSYTMIVEQIKIKGAIARFEGLSRRAEAATEIGFDMMQDGQ